MKIYLDGPKSVADATVAEQASIWYANNVELPADDEFRGLLVVDEESQGFALSWLPYDTTQQQIDDAVQVKLAKIKEARKKQPNARIGVYGIPSVRYWNDFGKGSKGWN